MQEKNDPVVREWLDTVSTVLETISRMEDRLELVVQFMLLQNALRLVVMSIHKMSGKSVEYDDDLYELFTDLYGIKEASGLGLLKLQGFAGIDVSMPDAQKLCYEDLVYFKDGVVSVYKKVKSMFV